MNEWFNGKIGTWFFIDTVTAQCSSRNRPSGTLVTAPKTVTSEAYRDMLVNNILPAIKENCHGCVQHYLIQLYTHARLLSTARSFMNKEDFDLNISLSAAEVARDVEMAAISSLIDSLYLANNCDDDEGDDDQDISWTDRADSILLATLALTATHLYWESTQCRKPGGGLLPRWLYHTALSCTPLLAPRDFWFGQWMGGPNGATFQGPLGASTHCIIPRPPTNNHWWIDATHHPFSAPWWRRLSAEIQSSTASHTTATYWFVVPDGSLGHALASNLTTTWLLTIPAGQLLLRAITSIHHTTTPQWDKLTTSNPVPIHIGFLTTSTTTPSDPGPTTLDRGSPPPGCPPTHCLHWAQTNIPMYDQYAHASRTYLEATYHTIYSATTGWKMFSTMTQSTRDWAASLTHLHAPHFHKQWLKRLHNDTAPTGHDRRIRTLRAHLQAKTRDWYSRRLSLLPPATPSPPVSNAPPIRPPRRPPDPKGLPPAA
ncbi:hypothetical protein H257_09900 [Aphanomyces astaci]|uniref:Uncharacterized protein n=1 Tax=Aphanomyces astaci TaxID=112090 RepID=W4G9H5_APHAT|nr:hypothetical protein H257_09900 [Aphanomyces astaci]ETV75941.1 hypothetical protein H257_09900 [Aphanomyces astaci]|eukprot:XP_009834583.1 hypothetical protein H257_09900 [Aphanomyces astaci]